MTEAKELAQDFEDTDCAIHKFQLIQHTEGGFALFKGIIVCTVFYFLLVVYHVMLHFNPGFLYPSGGFRRT